MANYNGLELDSIQAFRQATDDYIKLYCENNDIDLNNIHPLQWDDIIQDLYLVIYEPGKAFFKVSHNRFNEYDVEKVYLAFIYIFRHIHNKYKQTLKQLNFLVMLGISKQTLYNLSVEKLSSQSFDHDKNNLAEIIAEYCEQSYIQALEGTTQHMKYLPTLNKRYGYNMPGTNNTNKQAAVLVQRENVMQIDEKNSLQLPDVDK